MQKLVRINQVSYDKDLFKAWQLGSPVDQMFSVGGGIPRATNWMVTGDPGVGKCVDPDTLVTIRIDLTGEIKTLRIKDLHEFLR
jgi:predicted ATP-dependent serine protease